jgi:hypothetical protein
MRDYGLVVSPLGACHTNRERERARKVHRKKSEKSIEKKEKRKIKEKIPVNRAGARCLAEGRKKFMRKIKVKKEKKKRKYLRTGLAAGTWPALRKKTMGSGIRTAEGRKKIKKRFHLKYAVANSPSSARGTTR